MIARTTFLPAHRGTLYTSVGYTDTGREIATNPVAMRFSVIRIRYQTRTTSVRTDQSGSQGRAEESVYDGRILVHPEVTPETGHKVLVHSVEFTVEEVQPRYDVNGMLMHWQVDLVL